MRLALSALAVASIMLTGCAETVGGYAYQPYGTSYAGPAYPYGYPYGTAAPTYVPPLGYGPPIVGPYGGGVWVGGERRSYDWRNRPSHYAPPPGQPPVSGGWRAAQPPPAPRPPAIAPASPAEVQHNRQLLDQMGFRPNR